MGIIMSYARHTSHKESEAILLGIDLFVGAFGRALVGALGGPVALELAGTVVAVTFDVVGLGQ